MYFSYMMRLQVAVGSDFFSIVPCFWGPKSSAEDVTFVLGICRQFRFRRSKENNKSSCSTQNDYSGHSGYCKVSVESIGSLLSAVFRLSWKERRGKQPYPASIKQSF